MNFFNGSVTGDKQELYLDTGAFRLRVEKEQAEKLAGYIGKEVLLGVRPEDIHHPNFHPSDIHGAKIIARVELTEMMGSETYTYLIVGEDQNCIARVDPRARFRIGEDVEMIFNLDNMHVFDQQTELAIF